MNNIQNVIATTGNSDEHFDTEINFLARLNDLLSRRHALLTQKNRLQWIKDGDRNSAFFHRLHSYRTSRASISSIQVGDGFITVDVEIGNHVTAYYENLFKADALLSTDYLALDSFGWNTVSTTQNLILTSIPSNEEVREAVFGLDGSSSPGPDGFGGSFYHHCWTIIAADVIHAIVFLFESNSIPKV